jgi:hypothetical protein
MKKLITFLSTLLLCASAYAMPAANSQYSSTLHPLPNSMLHPPTDITIANATYDFIYAQVPNTTINDPVRPGTNDHIYNSDPNVYSVYIVLRDYRNNVFYSNVVCRLAIVTVSGTIGYYRVNTDSDLCN